MPETRQEILKDGSTLISVKCHDPHAYGKVYELSVKMTPEQMKHPRMAKIMRDRLEQAYNDHRNQMHG